MLIACCICVTASPWMARRRFDMRTLWHGLKRTLFWPYERGSWPYDILVLLIVLFVLVTPRRWFHDQAQSASATGAEIQLFADDAASHTRTYRLDAHLLPPAKRTTKATPELERETHDLLGRSVEDLRGRTFQVQTIRSVTGVDGSVAYYDVEIRPGS
jgi:hypothetical protein